MPVDPSFVACVFDPDDLIEIRLIPRGEQQYVKAGEVVRLDDSLQSANAAGEHVYVGANPRKRRGGKASDVALARCLFVDLDDTDVDSALGRISDAGLPTPSCTVKSGHGLHAYWRLTEPMHDLAAWTTAQEFLIRVLRSDPVIHDPPRIMRLPTFTNHKPPSALCEVIDAAPERRHSLEALIDENRNEVEKQRIRCHLSASSALSATPEDIIEMTLPQRQGERNASLMRLARGLKLNAGLDDRSLTDIKPYVRQWHDRAWPTIGSKEFDESWCDFVRAWPVAEVPLFADTVGDAHALAVRAAAEGRLPACANQYESVSVRLLVGLCANLAALRSNRRFFLSSHDAGDRLGVQPAQAWRYLNMLCVDGVIALVRRGNPRVANRYRWIGERMRDLT